MIRAGRRSARVARASGSRSGRREWRAGALGVAGAAGAPAPAAGSDSAAMPCRRAPRGRARTRMRKTTKKKKRYLALIADCSVDWMRCGVRTAVSAPRLLVLRGAKRGGRGMGQKARMRLAAAVDGGRARTTHASPRARAHALAPPLPHAPPPPARPPAAMAAPRVMADTGAEVGAGYGAERKKRVVVRGAGRRPWRSSSGLVGEGRGGRRPRGSSCGTRE